ncbi:MAG TPA: Na/Pi cotransporter family protein, partial [Clostridia bacterium]|nr:Na/Pi cotransporter family protein [Clostridia bacterium]
MVVGFVNAGLMSLQQAAGVIMGANIGTTITGQLVAFHLDAAAPVFLLTGVAMMMFSKSLRTQRLGQIIAGFGILFVGMGMMSQAMQPLRQNERFLSIMQSVGSSPLLAVLVGAAITTIIQSSSASVALTQVLAGQGLIPLDMAIYMVLGCAIGTCVTAMLSSVGTGPAARRAAIIHLLFNVAGAAIMLLLLQAVPLADFMRELSPSDIKRQIANANTLMKLAEVLILFPFANLLILASGFLVRGEEPKGEERRLIYLDDLILTPPPIAVAQVLKEVERMARISIDNLERSMRAYFEKDASLIPEVERAESVIDYLNHEITNYLIKLGQTPLPTDDVPLVASLYHVVNDLERVGDHAMNMAEFAQTSMDDNLIFTQQGEEEMRDMFSDVLRLLNLSLSIFHSRDRAQLQQAADLEESI